MAKKYQRIENTRIDLDLSQQEIADRLGITRVTYNSYEKGRTKISVEIMEALALLLGVTVAYLIGETDIKE